MTDQRRSGDRDRPNRSNKPTGRSSTGGGASRSRDGKPRGGSAGRGSKSRSDYGPAKGSGPNSSSAGRDPKPRRDRDGRPTRSGDERPRRDADFKPRGSGGKPRSAGGRSGERQGRDERPRRDDDFKSRGSGQRGERGRGERSGRDERPRRDADFKPRGSGQRGERGRDDRQPGRDTGRDEWQRDTSDDLPWPEEIFELELEPEVYKDIEAFGGRTETFAKHLLSVQVLAESDPEMAYQHAARVRDRVSRSALARHTACIAAYRTSRFKEAIKEESAYRRISGRFDLIPIAADCERGLGRPQRTLALLAEYEAERLDTDTRTELLIVAGGARRDLGDDDAARVLFQKAVRTARSPMATARSRYALGELLATIGEIEDARKWLQSAVEADEDSVWTDAAEVLETLA